MASAMLCRMVRRMTWEISSIFRECRNSWRVPCGISSFINKLFNGVKLFFFFSSFFFHLVMTIL